MKIKIEYSPLLINLEALELVDTFFIMTVAAIIGIRVFLALTGYPQVGSGGLHIAHMLWGGMLMFGCIMLQFLFLSKRAKILSAMVGGIGFGAFIDELGKFITSDNDYFFEPSIALIYVTLAGGYVGIHYLFGRMKVLPRDYAANALELSKEVFIEDLDSPEKEMAIHYLNQIHNPSPVLKSLKKWIKTLDPQSLKPDMPLITKLQQQFKDRYQLMLTKPQFQRWVMGLFIISSLTGVALALIRFHEVDSFWDWGLLLSSMVSGLMVLRGVIFHQRKRRIQAYRAYSEAVLISILMTMFFLFYHDQLLALLGVLVYAAVYGVTKYLIAQELVSVPAPKYKTF